MGRPSPNSIVRFPARTSARPHYERRRKEDYLFGFWLIVMSLLIFGLGVYVGANL